MLSLRSRLLSLSARHARELATITDERELQLRLDAIVRDALDEFAQMPLRVTDEHWLEKIDEREPTPAKRPRATK